MVNEIFIKRRYSYIRTKESCKTNDIRYINDLINVVHYELRIVFFHDEILIIFMFKITSRFISTMIGILHDSLFSNHAIYIFESKLL